LLAAGGIAAVAAPAFAATATYYVSPAGGGNCSSAASPCTLATALTDAASGSDGGDVVTIELAPGGYSGPIPIGGTESSLTLDGAGPGASVVNGGGSQPAVSISVTFPVALEHLGIIGGAATNGGGVDISNAGAHVTIEDSTIAGSAEGGGVYADGTVDIYGSTIADNVGDGIDTAGGTVELGADLLASNSGLDCAGGGISDAGYNYADDVSCPTGSGNSHDSAASLDLASLNTSTGTVAVTSSSEAYDVVPTGTTLSGDPTGAFCLGIDERGAPRIEGGASACSAGAYQYAGAVITGVSSPALELGLTVTLTGSNLGSVISATFGATPAAITSQTSTSLSLALPLSLAFGSQPITLVSQYDSATVPFAAVANPGVATLTLPPGEHGVPYSEPVPVSGGRAPFSFATVSGALPRGLSLSSAGVISGTDEHRRLRLWCGRERRERRRRRHPERVIDDRGAGDLDQIEDRQGQPQRAAGRARLHVRAVRGHRHPDWICDDHGQRARDDDERHARLGHVRHSRSEDGCRAGVGAHGKGAQDARPRRQAPSP
jgi:hypothetical protein